MAEQMTVSLLTEDEASPDVVAQDALSPESDEPRPLFLESPSASLPSFSPPCTPPASQDNRAAVCNHSPPQCVPIATPSPMVDSSTGLSSMPTSNKKEVVRQAQPTKARASAKTTLEEDDLGLRGGPPRASMFAELDRLATLDKSHQASVPVQSGQASCQDRRTQAPVNKPNGTAWQPAESAIVARCILEVGESLIKWDHVAQRVNDEWATRSVGNSTTLRNAKMARAHWVQTLKARLEREAGLEVTFKQPVRTKAPVRRKRERVNQGEEEEEMSEKTKRKR
ncbi:hypothetical protein FA10DRAFT_258512 [Acaromyces ingoldii]|uniref:Uncharacterized protein n=1 Tax=Acaromyces ingoldii TaxID=215250 RepID=A0A316Z2M2_9BASI|nr:hypothetical protein FA10DRAFT_258512 [Acaromyces ingoldii]PWN94425.1 hypothetical protein FA10DRAFT_258512 [Acaromyces ingoldii]